VRTLTHHPDRKHPMRGRSTLRRIRSTTSSRFTTRSKGHNSLTNTYWSASSAAASAVEQRGNGDKLWITRARYEPGERCCRPKPNSVLQIRVLTSSPVALGGIQDPKCRARRFPCRFSSPERKAESRNNYPHRLLSCRLGRADAGIRTDPLIASSAATPPSRLRHATDVRVRPCCRCFLADAMRSKETNAVLDPRAIIAAQTQQKTVTSPCRFGRRSRLKNAVVCRALSGRDRQLDKLGVSH